MSGHDTPLRYFFVRAMRTGSGTISRHMMKNLGRDAVYPTATRDRRGIGSTEPVDVSDAFRERVADDNALDMELYDYAQQLVNRVPRERSGEQ